MKGNRPKGAWSEPLEEWRRGEKDSAASFDPRLADWKIGIMFPAVLMGKSLSRWIRE
jgi:hypothetical protein